MGQETLRTIVAIITGFIGLGILAVILGGKNTLGIIQDTAVGVSTDLTAAEAPATGQSNLGATQAQWASS